MRLSVREHSGESTRTRGTQRPDVREIYDRRVGPGRNGRKVAGWDRARYAARFRWQRYRTRTAQIVLPLRRGTVLFVCGPRGDARRYRCDHQREQLELAGVSAKVVHRDGLRLASLGNRDVTVVLYRVPWDYDVAELIKRSRAGGGAVVLADVDDLVFDLQRAELIGGVERLDEQQRAAYLSQIRGLRRTLSEAGGVLVSTDPLRDEVVGLNPNLGVTYNSVSAEMTRQSERAARPASRDGVLLAYLSGTPTHDRDFLEAADAIVWALERYREVRFLAVGHLRLDSRFDAFGDRVQLMRAVPWQDLPGIVADVDVNLAPLEAGNRFTECKSCIKYLEAALLSVPTLASPRPDFARAIRHGVNGLLADDADAWRRALTELIESPTRRAELGAAARADVLAHGTTAARADETASVVAHVLAGARTRQATVGR